jgi:competence ComEA-like helix-hairpin-helix protein
MEKLDVVEPLLVNINTADTTELKSLKGIGSYYAKQIVEYRERLGGFYRIDQLYEIERLREETIQMIEPFIIFDTTIIRKVHINSDKASVLVRHPYITWNMAKNIEDHREFKKRFKSVDELLIFGLLTDELYSKLAPYLEL